MTEDRSKILLSPDEQGRRLACRLTEKEREVQALMAEMGHQKSVIEALNRQLASITGSTGWTMLQFLWRVRLCVVPHGSPQERVLRLGMRAFRVWRKDGARALAVKAARRIRGRLSRSGNSAIPSPTVDAYQIWLARNAPSDMELLEQVRLAHGLTYRPLFSVLVPVYKPAPAHLREAIESVLAQTYDRWELCLVDGGSCEPNVRDTLATYAGKDSRIHVEYLDRNLGISGNSNAALAMASGEFVVLLDHDDMLAPSALYEIARLLNANSEWDLIYSDHDLLVADSGHRFAPLFKPDWSPDTMLSANYVTHLTAMRTSLVREVGGFDPTTDGAQDWDLFLRISERTQRIAHIPKVLYHWRDAPGSTAVSTRAKPYVAERQLRVLSGHLTRQGLANARAFFDRSGFIRVAWDAPQSPLVSIIIPSDGANRLLQECIASIRKFTTYPHYELVIVNNGPRQPDEFAYYKHLSESKGICILHYDREFNYSAVCNLGARHARGDVLLFLNNDVRALEAGWLSELVLWIQRRDIGVVGAKLLTPDGKIQHAGVVLGLTGLAGHVFAEAPEGVGGIFGFAEWYRDYLAVTGACMMLRRSVFEQAGGFDETFLLCGSDVELCLRVRALGYRVVYNPFARLQHLGAATHQGRIPSQDFETSLRAYRPYLDAGDPYYNPNLSCQHLIPALRWKDEPSWADLAAPMLALVGGRLGLLSEQDLTRRVPADSEDGVE